MNTNKNILSEALLDLSNKDDIRQFDNILKKYDVIGLKISNSLNETFDDIPDESSPKLRKVICFDALDRNLPYIGEINYRTINSIVYLEGIYGRNIDFNKFPICKGIGSVYTDPISNHSLISNINNQENEVFDINKHLPSITFKHHLGIINTFVFNSKDIIVRRVEEGIADSIDDGVLEIILKVEDVYDLTYNIILKLKHMD